MLVDAIKACKQVTWPNEDATLLKTHQNHPPASPDPAPSTPADKS
jgi:hypothetical protein